eukprot:1144816-Pelagomonas_calceolata.AAC.2
MTLLTLTKPRESRKRAQNICRQQDDTAYPGCGNSPKTEDLLCVPAGYPRSSSPQTQHLLTCTSLQAQLSERLMSEDGPGAHAEDSASAGEVWVNRGGRKNLSSLSI